MRTIGKHGQVARIVVMAAIAMMLAIVPAAEAYAAEPSAQQAYGEDGITAVRDDGTSETSMFTQAIGTDVPSIRQADDDGGSYMTNIDLTNLAQKDNDTSDNNGGGSNFVQNALSVMQLIVNKVLLPIGIIAVVARLMYIAIFPLMIGIDPFDVIDTDTFREGPQSIMRRSTRGGNGDGSKDPSFGVKEYDWGGKGDWRVKLTQEQIEYIMKQELIGSGKVLLVIIIIWGVINMAIWLAGTVLGYIHI